MPAILPDMIGGCYVLMSGAPVSAFRAFGMAMLVVLAILHDRMALTLRNVCLAAFAILAFNPMALFTASFQLSSAATAILVIWHESRARRCLLYTSDAADDSLRVDLGGRRIIKKLCFVGVFCFV